MQLLSCHSCLRHCLRAIVQRPTLAHVNALARRTNLPRPPSRALALALQRRRNYATEVQKDGLSQLEAAQPKDHPADPSTKYYRSNAFRRERKTPYFDSKLRKDQNKQTLRAIRRNPAEEVIDANEKRILKRELAWLAKDPLQLADYIRSRLSKGQDEKALALVRYASKEMDTVVSWNHVIDHYLALGHPKTGLKLYNEMKKRAQKPDSYTYTILLRGIGNHAHFPHSVGNALSIYHSMSAPNSKVPPGTIHTNLALRVCARANDMEALWSIASKVPERGAAAADSKTFTTILHAIRHDALLAPPDATQEWIARKRESAIIDGRRIWEDIVNKWRAGDLVIDEDLVCAMGRLLLIGSRPRDWDDVLSLVEQTMDIPRLVRRLGAGPHSVEKLRLPYTPQDMKEEDLAPIDPTDQFRRGGEFDPVNLEKTVGGGRKNMAYVRPGNNTLSLVMDACLKMSAKRTAQDYWNLLADEDSWNIRPDEDNLHLYLRILRHARASADAVAFVKTGFKKNKLQPKAKTFRIAMSTCVRDKNNPNVFTNANILLDTMAETLADPDARTIAMYTEVLSYLSSGEQILNGLDRLTPQFVNLRSILSYGEKDGAKAPSTDDRDAALQAFKNANSCYDRLMNHGLVPRDRFSELTQRKAKISAYVLRTMRQEKIEKGAEVRNPELNASSRNELKEKRKEMRERRQGLFKKRKDGKRQGQKAETQG